MNNDVSFLCNYTGRGKYWKTVYMKDLKSKESVKFWRVRNKFTLLKNIIPKVFSVNWIVKIIFYNRKEMHSKIKFNYPFK